ncbi:MAG TPA: hypothetical protein VJH05_01695 [Candidatus Paceibacterota bacterium]
MTFGLAFGIYVVFLAIYWFFVYSILWHLKEYILPMDYSKWVVRGFVFVAIIFNIFSFILLFNLPF